MPAFRRVCSERRRPDRPTCIRRDVVVTVRTERVANPGTDQRSPRLIADAEPVARPAHVDRHNGTYPLGPVTSMNGP